MIITIHHRHYDNHSNNYSAAGTDSDPSSTRGLELGMSGMSLLPSAMTAAAAAGPNVSSGDSVHSHHSTGTAASAPTKLSRPPGLNVPPIGKPGHAKSASNASTTAQTATLTPTSSPGNDLYHLTGGGMGGRYQASSPSSSDLLLHHHHHNLPPGISSLSVVGSFDTDDGDHDGLLGLQALRERSYSSPGPPTYSTSPRELVGGVRGVIASASSQQGRPRTVSKDSGRSQSGSRPPLAGGVALSPHTGGGGGGGDLSGYGPGSRSRDASPPPNAGIISRPYSPYGSGGGGSVGGGSAAGAGNDHDRSFDSSLRRAFSNDSDYTSGGGASLQGGQLPISSHSRTNSGGSFHGQSQQPHQQPPPSMYQQPHRVQRSQSQPGPLRGAPHSDQYYDEGPAMNRRGSDYGAAGGHSGYQIPTTRGDNEYGHQLESHDMRYGGGAPPPHHSRSMSMQQSSGNPSFYDMQRRGSTGYYGGPRRDEYDEGRRYPDHERTGKPVYPRQERLISPAHSPMHSHYGSHSRASSDMGSTFSASPMSLNSGQPLYGRHGINHSDEDLSHPLVGENIEVPGEEQYYNDGMMPYPKSASIGHPPSYGGESHHMSSMGQNMAIPKNAYNVKFKRMQRVFEIGPRLNRDLNVGTYVKVEADRGEDLGIVVGKAKNTPMRSASFAGGMGDLPPPPGTSGDMKKIIRLATHDEVSLLQIKRVEEEELLNICRTKVRQRGLHMHVVDAEYQFDRHKLTFFFEAEGRVDFRELVRDLFSIYKTRIWMQQLDKSATATCPVAPAPAPLVMDYGTPIIAPASEYEDFAHSTGPSDDHYTG